MSIPPFGDSEADALAAGQLGVLYPDRTVEQVDIDAVAAGWRRLHCATQRQPAAP